jgi:hypothetical protein
MRVGGDTKGVAPSATLREVAQRGTREISSYRGLGRAAVIATLTAMCLMAPSCSPGASSSTGGPANDNFLSEVHDEAPDVSSYRSDVQLVRLGHAACDGFSAGASYVELADRLALQEGSNPLPAGDLGAVISSAARALCPRYEPLVS